MTDSMSYRVINLIMKSSENNVSYSEMHVITCIKFSEFILEAENVGKYSLGVSSLNIKIRINLSYLNKSTVLNWALIEGRQRCWKKKPTTNLFIRCSLNSLRQWTFPVTKALFCLEYQVLLNKRIVTVSLFCF